MKQLIQTNQNRCAVIAWQASKEHMDLLPSMEACIHESGRVNLLLEKRATDSTDLEAYAKRQAQSLLAYAATGVVCFIAEKSDDGNQQASVVSQSFNSANELEEFVERHAAV